MSSKKLALPLAVALSGTGCIPPQVQDYLSMYGFLQSRQAVAAVLRDGNGVVIDPVSRIYTIHATAPAQVGTSLTCTFIPDDLVDVRVLDRHINRLASEVATVRASGGSSCQVASACWCLNLMANVRQTITSGTPSHRTWAIDICRDSTRVQ